MDSNGGEDVKIDALSSVSLGPKPEDAMLKAGLLAISEMLGNDDLLNFPRRANGTPLLMRQGFFQRLLSGEVSIQDCSISDCQAAEADVRRLSVNQLLSIRCRHFDFEASGTSNSAKAAFLGQVDRSTMTLLGERLLPSKAGCEKDKLTDAQRAVLIRHIVLIYGAHHEIMISEEKAPGSEWWLVVVGGTQRYVNVPKCELVMQPPGGPVYVYRSHTLPDPRSNKRSRVFRWMVLLVSEPEKWDEDPLVSEQPKRSFGGTKTGRASIKVDGASAKSNWERGAAAAPQEATPPKFAPTARVAEQAPVASEAPAAAAVTPAAASTVADDAPGDTPEEEGGDGGAFGIFDGFNVEDLFDEDADEAGGAASACASPSADTVRTHAGSADGDMDDFFDSLLAEPLIESGGEAGGGAKGDDSSREAGAAAGAASAAGDEKFASGDAPTGESGGDGGAGSVGGAGGAEGNGEGANATPEVVEEDIGPPKDAEEAHLREVLQRFYTDKRHSGKLSNVPKIARRYAGEGVVDLWAQLAVKYQLTPAVAVQWLATSLGPSAPVMWPKGDTPESAKASFATLVEAMAGDGAEESKSEALQKAMEAGDVDSLGYFLCQGLATPASRPTLWRALLGWPQDVGLKERREAYQELQSRMAEEMAAAAKAAPAEGAPPAAAAADDAEGAKEDSEAAKVGAGSLEALKEEIQVVVKAMWKTEDFMSKAGVEDAVVAIVLTHSWRGSRFVRSSCEVAALLLYVMAQTKGIGLGDAEADAYWCLSQLMAEAQDTIAAEESLKVQAAQVRRSHYLLATYDPVLANLLTVYGLATLPSLRLGAVFCTRSGFSLEDCARVWDTLLADPQRFELCDHVVVALMLSRRGELMARDDVAGLAETLLAAPVSDREGEDVASLLKIACAICAFERRCAAGPKHLSFPARPPASVADAWDTNSGSTVKDMASEALESAQVSLNSFLEKAAPAAQSTGAAVSSFFGKMKSSSSEAWGSRFAAGASLAKGWEKTKRDLSDAATKVASKASEHLDNVDQFVGEKMKQQRASGEGNVRISGASEGEPGEPAKDDELVAAGEATWDDGEEAPPLIAASEDGPPQLVAVSEAEKKST